MIKGTDLILAEFQGTCVLLYNDYTKYSSEQKQLLKETGASIGPCTAIAIFGNQKLSLLDQRPIIHQSKSCEQITLVFSDHHLLSYSIKQDYLVDDKTTDQFSGS
ncbi:MAG: hypothetical protein EZS28_039024 [Streblomastix strix]|uniref:Uncharacterized protein n=1 Tax=Streblomastix strix TaxID=222440 RepID=A0A5J4U579_9EUKA|nr:MAG: hypothetical protein EZS28_039024 [Streblomastix strix]